MSKQNNWIDALKKLLRQPAFLVAAGVLLISAISLNAATQYMQLYFKKYPVEMSADFNTIPSHLGHWIQVSKDEKLGEDMEHELAAVHYLYRDYVDDRIIPAEVIAQFDGKSSLERKQMMLNLQRAYPAAVINLGLTYYTGSVDTVAHIPDRCYIADGFEPTSHDVIEMSAFDGHKGRAPEGSRDICFINFEDQVASRQSASKNVAYFFHANGKYTPDPIGVRVLLQNLTERYAYYSKIELLTQMTDAEKSKQVMNDFLKSALPEVERCMPDWEKVTSQQPTK
jgi:hypothetical protein